MPRNEHVRPRAERRRKAREAKHENQPTDPSRRKFIIALGLGAIGVAASAYGVPKILDLFSTEEPELDELSGEIDEVKFYLDKWEDEVGGDKNKLEKKLPQIAQLSIAYFSNQMAEMFPQRSNDYDKEKLKDKVVFLDKNSFEEKKKPSACDTDEYEGALALIDSTEDNQRIYVNKDSDFVGPRAVLAYFYIMLHELAHLASHKKVYSSPIRSSGISGDISYEQGLVAYVKKEGLSTSARECFIGYRKQAEEAVVDHNASELFSRLGLTFQGSRYDELVKAYRKNIINKLYGGNHRELLGYQQLTQPNEFFGSIGRKLIGRSVGATVEQEIGDEYMRRLFLK